MSHFILMSKSVCVKFTRIMSIRKCMLCLYFARLESRLPADLRAFLYPFSCACYRCMMGLDAGLGPDVLKSLQRYLNGKQSFLSCLLRLPPIHKVHRDPKPLSRRRAGAYRCGLMNVDSTVLRGGHEGIGELRHS